MSQDVTNVNLSSIEVRYGDQPIFVAADVEDDPFANFIGGRKCGAQFTKALKISVLHDLEPTS